MDENTRFLHSYSIHKDLSSKENPYFQSLKIEIIWKPQRYILHGKIRNALYIYMCVYIYINIYNPFTYYKYLLNVHLLYKYLLDSKYGSECMFDHTNCEDCPC